MFLSNDFYKKLSGILLEADEDENVEGSGETIDTAPESKSTDGGTEDSNDNGEDGLSEEDELRPHQ